MTADANESAINSRAHLTRFGWCWLGFLGSAFFGNWLLGRLDNTTLLTPDYSNALIVGFIVAGIVAVVSAFVGYSQSKGPLVQRSVAAVFCFGILGALSTVVLAGTITDLTLAKLYFPADKTETFNAMLPIGRAYRMFARVGGYSWIIQPSSLWTNIDITKSDYDFMAGNRPIDGAHEPDDVPSHGIFCAKVTMQESGDALRVLHAGSYKLPQGSVVRCPQAAMGQPYLKLR
jgi:hypothetical protein